MNKTGESYLTGKIENSTWPPTSSRKNADCQRGYRQLGFEMHLLKFEKTCTLPYSEIMFDRREGFESVIGTNRYRPIYV